MFILYDRYIDSKIRAVTGTVHLLRIIIMVRSEFYIFIKKIESVSCSKMFDAHLAVQWR